MPRTDVVLRRPSSWSPTGKVNEDLTQLADGVPHSQIDLNEPPANPPPGCIDPVMWKIAIYLYSNHTASASGSCSRCGGQFPCLGHALAVTGLRTALGDENEDSAYWRGYARLHGSVG
jgi:hypothetical protein